jgi:putative endonuclease
VQAKDFLGRLGEDRAVAFLTGLGYRILDRNWRCAVGEIDIVALDGPDLVVVEVKTRTSRAFGHPFEAVTAAKAGRLWRLGSAWRRGHPDVHVARTRIDLVAVLGAHVQDVDHLRGLR